jgi:hypothetical protein
MFTSVVNEQCFFNKVLTVWLDGAILPTPVSRGQYYKTFLSVIYKFLLYSRVFVRKGW